MAVPDLTKFTCIKPNRQLNLPNSLRLSYQSCNRAIAPKLRYPSAARGRRRPRR